MPEPNSTLWPRARNAIPLTPSEQTMMPDAAGVAKVMPDLTKTIAHTASSPRYAALKGQPEGEASYGAAGLPGAGMLGSSLASLAGAGPLAGAGAAIAGAAAVPLAAAYGIGKLIAPERVDAAVGRVRDFLSSKLKKAEAVGSAYETGMAEAIPGARFLEKLLPQDKQQLIADVKEQNPLVTKAGSVAGNVGLMAAPGMTLLKGASTGAKIAAALGNAAINAAPFAIGTGLDVGAETGDVGKGIKAGLVTEGLGAATGGLLGGVTQIPAVQKALAKFQLVAAGIPSSALNKVMRGYAKARGMSPNQIDAFVAKRSPDLVNNVADKITQFNAYNPKGKAKLKEYVTDGFEAHGHLFDEATKDVGLDHPMVIKAVGSDADLVAARARFGDKKVNAAIKKIGTEINEKGWTESRKTLQDYIDSGSDFAATKQSMAMTDPRRLESDVAGAWRDYVDEVADGLATHARTKGVDIPDLHELKAMYPATLAIQKAAGKEGTFLPQVFGGGSDTATRIGMEAMGGMVGGVTSDWSDPANIPVNLVKIAGAGLAGRMLNRGVGRLSEMATGRAAGALRNAEGLGAGQMGKLGAQAASNLPQMLSGGPTMQPGPAMGQEEPPPPTEAPTTIPMQPIPNAPIQPPSPQQVMSNASDTMTHAADPAPRVPGFNPTAMSERLQEWYQVHTRRMGNDLSFDDFTNQLKGATNGFSPDNPLTYKIMVDDPSEAERLFKAHMTLKKLDGVHLEDALNYYTHPLNRIGGTRWSSDVGRAEDMAHTQIVDALSSMGLGSAKEVEGRLKKIAWNPKMKDKDKLAAVTDWMASQGGIPIQQLMDLGLWH
jgi:hypothetical protein